MFLGMRGTGDWVTGQRPLNWRQNIMYLYPNGMAPLTAILSMMGTKSVDDPQFHWWTEEIGSVGGAFTGPFTLPDLSVPYAPGPLAAAGDTLYISVTAALGRQMRAGHEILLRDTSDYRVDTVGKVTDVSISGVLATVSVMLLEADANAGPSDLSDATRFLIIGNINPEGGEMPNAIALNPVKHQNFTQIFRTPLSITRTARKTRLRTGDDYQKAKRECLEMHSIEMELAYFWGIATERTGDNGKLERTTQGIINFIIANAAAGGHAVVDDYTLNPTFTGLPWATNGERWFKARLEELFRYGAAEKLAFVGSGALLGIDALAMTGGQVNLTPGQKTYGMQIREWITPFGSIMMKTHPLFSFDITTRNMMVIIEPKELEYKYIDDTTFFGESSAKKHPQGYGHRRIDGTEEEFLTECGLEFGFPDKCAVLNGVGLDA